MTRVQIKFVFIISCYSQRVKFTLTLHSLQEIESVRTKNKIIISRILTLALHNIPDSLAIRHLPTESGSTG